MAKENVNDSCLFKINVTFPYDFGLFILARAVI